MGVDLWAGYTEQDFADLEAETERKGFAMDPTQLPDCWRPIMPDAVTAKGPPVMPDVDVLNLPECDTRDPAMLAAFYGPFGWADHLRKIVLANTREMIRAQFVLTGEKVTESRLDDLAHKHPSYVLHITEGLEGRRLYYVEEQKRGYGS